MQQGKLGPGLRALGLFVCLATALPVVRSNRWWIRLFDYPRVQVAALQAAVLAAALRRARPDPVDRTLLRLVLFSLAAQLLQIRRYTRLASREVLQTRQHGQRVRLLISNVLMGNRTPEPLLHLIDEVQPDLLLLLEPDRWWEKTMSCVEHDLPHTLKEPKNNTYGMLLYSRLPLRDPQVRYLVSSDIPSIRTRVALPGGGEFTFYGVHPKPPGRQTRNGTIGGTRQRDAEVVVVANEVSRLQTPVIVAGDFNDVAWSHTTRRFQRIGRMLDPRVGRGFYNTYNANYPILRFPLDHLFHSDHFTLVGFQRQRHIGSDHFPICVELSLEPKAEKNQEAPPPSARDYAEAHEDLQAVKAR